ncbi:MAG: MMPL family transporter [Lachnospiraceae bacterium]
MTKFGEKVVKLRIPIFIFCLLLLIPSAIGYFNTRVNYDILSYLPEDIETMKGQDILVKDFGTGAFSLVIVNNMEDKEVSVLKEKFEKINHVSKVVWYDTFMDLSVPMSILPTDVKDSFNTEDSTLMAVIFDDTTSSDETMDAITNLKHIAGKNCMISGMSAVVTDTKDLSEREAPIYVLIAVLCSVAVLCLTMDSFLIPFLFLLSIGFAIIYNLGSNLFLGEISYITKALAAVLQLGVTMDYSIFLWHSYKEQQELFSDKKEAMAHAIASTITSVVGSSITTVAGFAALCFMSFTLGLDLGIVMAKGVIIGVLCCVTLLPSIILLFDKPLTHTAHKPLLPSFEKPSKFVNKHYIFVAILFALLLIPAIYGNNHTPVYYALDETLPKDLDSIVANSNLEEHYHMNCIDMVLVNSHMNTSDCITMSSDLDQVAGVKAVLNLESLIGPTIPESMLPDTIKEIFKNDRYELMLILSEYKVASPESNQQVKELDKIIKSYDKKGMLVGEAPCTRDLITITDKDFKTVNTVSIVLIFLIILLIFKSISLPIILVSVIEFAIFVNMSFPYYMHSEVPFIASVVIGTIQLGATVDYAILMTTRYIKERSSGLSKKEAVSIAHITSTPSILVSAFSFFAATFGVGLFSKIDMISSLCTLMARGALISMVVVLLVLPSMLLIFDRVIIHTTLGFQGAKTQKIELRKKMD